MRRLPSAFAAGLCIYACLAVLHACLSHASPETWSTWICRAGRCDPTRLRPSQDKHALMHLPREFVPYENDNVVAALHRSTHQILSSGRKPLAIHIGPSTLIDDELRGYSALERYLSLGHFVLVEPLPSAISALGANIHGVIPTARVLNAAMCEGTEGKQFHYYDEDALAKDYPGLDFPSIVLHHIGSFDIRYSLQRCIEKGFRRRIMKQAFFMSNLSNGSTLDLRAYEHWLRSYIRSQSVPCYTPSKLLAEFHAVPDDVVYVVIDAEGFDHVILSKFLEKDGFRPAYLQIEMAWDQFVQLSFLEVFVRNGYDIYQHAEDIIAVRTEDVHRQCTTPRGAGWNVCKDLS